MSLADRLRIAREQAGLSQGQAMNLCDVHSQQISRYERGETEPGGVVLVKLAELYGVSIDWLLRGTEHDPGVDLSALDPADARAIRQLVSSVSKPRSKE